MRRRFAILTVLAALAAPVASAQAQARVGVISGISRATFTGGGARGITWRTALILGGVVDVPLGEGFSVRPELQFATKGSRGRAGSADAAMKLSYLQLPVLLQLLTGSDVLLRPRLFGGVSLGMLLSCRRKEVNCDDDPGLVTHDFDSGLLVGGEVEVLGVGLGVRYEAGLGSVTAVQNPGLEIQNGVLSLTLRYLFPWR